MNTINIHGREYVPVSERVRLAHLHDGKLSIVTELIATTPEAIVKATVTTDKGIFTGYSASNSSKAIEKTSPIEIAETSAVGRALGFAGYGIDDGIASADEVENATSSTETTPTFTKKAATTQSEPLISDKQLAYLAMLMSEKGVPEENVYEEFDVMSRKDLTKKQASVLIDRLMKMEASK